MGTSIAQKLYSTPVTVTTAAGANFDARGYSYFTILAPTGSTVTYSRVMSMSASSHNSDPATAQGTVASNTMSAVAVDWPFYRVTTSGGSCQVSLV